jgi:hypothetical protein
MRVMMRKSSFWDEVSDNFLRIICLLEVCI